MLDLSRVFEEERVRLEVKRRKEDYRRIKRISKGPEKWLEPPTSIKKALKEVEKWKSIQNKE